MAAADHTRVKTSPPQSSSTFTFTATVGSALALAGPIPDALAPPLNMPSELHPPPLPQTMCPRLSKYAKRTCDHSPWNEYCLRHGWNKPYVVLTMLHKRLKSLYEVGLSFDSEWLRYAFLLIFAPKTFMFCAFVTFHNIYVLCIRCRLD